MFIVIVPFWASGEQKYPNVKPTFENKRLSKEEKKQWQLHMSSMYCFKQTLLTTFEEKLVYFDSNVTMLQQYYILTSNRRNNLIRITGPTLY